MSATSDFAIVYDLSSSTERRKVFKLLSGYGFNVQRSVFECRLTRSSLDKLIVQLNDLNIKSGHIKLYRLIYNSNTHEMGNKHSCFDDTGPLYIV